MTETQQIAEANVRKYINKASLIFGQKFPIPRITWSLRGKTAGTACYSRWVINLHPELAERVGEEYEQTVGHEIAHLVTDRTHGVMHTRRGQHISHGWAWKSVMRRLGLNPERCHTYDMTGIGRTRRTTAENYIYTCGCCEHTLSALRHKRFQNGAYRRLHCCKCKGSLTFVEIRT